MKRMKVGIMGGTFNPIHFGHLILAENAFELFELHAILFIPCGEPPHKNEEVLIDKQHRYKMVQLAIEDNHHFDLSSIEMDRKGFSYSVDTLTTLTKENPNTDYYFIIGADSLFKIHNWKDPERLLSMCQLIVAARDDLDKEKLIKEKTYVENRYKVNIHLLSMPNIEISSTLIRERVGKKKTIKYFVPKDVEHYIYMNGLYKLDQKEIL